MLAVCGRDMLAPLEELRRRNAGPWPPAGVSLPALRRGGVHVVLATVFTEPIDRAAPPPCAWECQYHADDPTMAFVKGRAQMEVYRGWCERGALALDPRDALARGAAGGPLDQSEPLHAGILVENADPIRGPDDLPWWVERGVVAVGLAWAQASRYAAGNATPAALDRGLTPLGRDMVRAMDDLGVVHDLSHLSDRAMDELLALTDRPVMASHSNCRALFKGQGAASQRHLRDETIREIAGRGGVIGLNLFRRFLRDEPAGGWDGPGQAGVRASIDDALDHVEHVCAVVGHRGAVGLGSDMDGGFSSAEMCDGIDSPAGLPRLAEGLEQRGWSEAEIEGFASGNWRRFLGGNGRVG
jgi:membrane dipeptidase